MNSAARKAIKWMPVMLLPALLPAASWSQEINNLPINQLQVIGSHNSYKQSIDAPLFRMIRQSDSSVARHIDYSHISLPDQLSLGLLNLEIDVYADTKGGKYAHPKGLEWEGKGAAAYDPEGEMEKPGFKVFHIQDIDFRSSCPTLKDCLLQLKKWSDAHKDHYPVFITMNAKDAAIDRPGFTVPEKFTPEVFKQLDREIVKYLGRKNILAPDDVRGAYATLENAVLYGKWPTLQSAKGKFIFILDETGDKQAAYLAAHASMKKQLLFVNAAPGTPQAAIMIINDPVKDFGRIRALVQKGYMIRTRADADTEEARRDDKSRFEAACKSGAQIITTDYYQPSTHFASGYKVSFAGGRYFRIDPLYILP